MHFTSTLSVLATALSLAVGTSAWTQSGDGTWVANNEWHYLYRTGWTAHQSCTWMNTEDPRAEGTACAYWTNGQGGTFNGRCQWQGPPQNTISCA
ncbi:Ff.00g099990.m01.CDS01 [Fusarium sp. VM40]|nr:Ff.00g099990.m01.CDS01 [Fusarium sp. VM40]